MKERRGLSWWRNWCQHGATTEYIDCKQRLHSLFISLLSLVDAGCIIGSLLRTVLNFDQLEDASTVDHPDDERYRQLRTSTTTFNKVVASVQGGESMLMSVGFRDTDSAALVLPFDASLDELLARHLEFAVGVCRLRCATKSGARICRANGRQGQHRKDVEETLSEQHEEASQPSRQLQANREKERPSMRTVPRGGIKRVTQANARSRVR
jgi:hypothetical protein